MLGPLAARRRATIVAIGAAAALLLTAASAITFARRDVSADAQRGLPALGALERLWRPAGEAAAAASASAAAARPAVCSMQPELDEIAGRWGERALVLSEAYFGSGERVGRVLDKLLDGEPISIAVLGGSISEGYGLDKPAGEVPWPNLLFDWIQAHFPHPEHAMHNGAIAAMGTDVFAPCYKTRVPDDADLYILEAAVNDMFVDFFKNVETTLDTTDYAETLVRELLTSPAGPAVVLLSLWSVPHETITAAAKHAIVSEYYDVPRISSQTWLLKYLMQNPEEAPTHYNQADLGHQSQLGHMYIADIVKWYLASEICRSERRAAHPLPQNGTLVPSAYAPRYVPALDLRQRFMYQKPRPDPVAFCARAGTAGGTGAGGVPGVVLQPLHNDGWKLVETGWGSWWIAEEPGAQITFGGINVTGGRIGVVYYRSADPTGNIRCWVDNNVRGAKTFSGMWRHTLGSYAPIQDYVFPGLHQVTCVVVPETDDPAGVSHHARIGAVVAT